MLSQENSKKLEPQLPGVGATCGKRLSRSQISAPDWLDREIEVGEGRKRKERRRDEKRTKTNTVLSLHVHPLVIQWIISGHLMMDDCLEIE